MDGFLPALRPALGKSAQIYDSASQSGQRVGRCNLFQISIDIINIMIVSAEAGQLAACTAAPLSS